MPDSLRSEIRQGKPFNSLFQEAALNLTRTAATQGASFEAMLRPHGISSSQYNILRILRGAGAGGLYRNEIRDRLLTHMPDVTRLLDRMVRAGLVTRRRSSSDRRMVSTHLTRRGRDLVDSLDDAVEAEHRRWLGHMDEGQLRSLIALLSLARHPAG